MKTFRHKYMLLASCITLLLSACAAGSVTAESGKVSQTEESSKIQVPKSYPCQNLHVKTGNCPPR